MRAEEIDEKASLWLAREQHGLSAKEQGEFDVWLAQSPRHMVSYLRLKTAWERAGRLAALRAPMRPPQRRSRWMTAGIPAAAAALAVFAYAVRGHVTPVPQARPQADVAYSTRTGETRSYRLADGTRIELNTNSRVRVAAKDRAVTLEAGEAFFQVVHDAGHPFTVTAGKRRITDLGTKFAVHLDGDSVRVLVSEGRVKVETAPGTPGPAGVVADGGHAVIVNGMQALVFAEPESQIASELSWRDGMLTFDQQPLPEVAEAFNRYNSRHIQVEGRARRIRIGGSFKADNVDAFVTLLQQGFRVSVKNKGDKILVSR